MLLTLLLGQGSSGGGSVTGTASFAESAESLSASGQVAVSGTYSSTETAETLSASGAVAVNGSGSLSESTESLSSSGQVAITATGSVSETAETLSATGTVSGGSVTGTGSVSELAETLFALGSVLVSGSVSVTEASESVASSGSVLVSGTGSLTEGTETLSAASSVLVVGIGSLSESGEALNASASVSGGAVSGAANLIQDNQTLSAEGYSPQPEVVNTWLGGGSSLKRLDKRQTEDEKQLEREALGIIDKITPIIEEKVRVKAKKENAEAGSSDYFDLVAYEYLLNEQIAKIRADILLEKIKQRVISDNIAALIEESLIKRQAEIETQQFLEYQRIIEEDLIFVFSMLAEM